MRLKRGENWFKQLGRVAFQLNRSSDGKWEEDGQLLGFFHFILPRRGEAPHDDKMCCGLVFGEYSLFIAWNTRSETRGIDMKSEREICGWCDGIMRKNGTGNWQCEDCFMVRREFETVEECNVCEESH